MVLGKNSQSGGDTADPAGGGTDVNPLIVGCNTCETVARAVQLSLSSTEAKAAIKAEGLSTKYNIVVENRTPLMTIAGGSGSPTNTVDTLNGVIDRINEELETRQSDINAPSDQRITANVLSQDTAAKGDFGGRSKARAAILAAGALAAIGVSLLLEGVKLRFASGVAAKTTSTATAKTTTTACTPPGTAPGPRPAPAPTRRGPRRTRPTPTAMPVTRHAHTSRSGGSTR